MPLIALGWCMSGQNLPPTLSLIGDGAVKVIAAEGASTPRHRLDMLQAVFEAGIDCLPLSPEQSCPVNQALNVAAECSKDLQHQISQLAGSGQLTLGLSWNDSVHVPQPTGRDFIRALHHRSQKLKLALQTLTATAAHRRTAILTSRAGCRLDILVRRDQVDTLRANIAAAATGIPASDLSLLVTGLWPPLAFARPPRPGLEEAA
jgi:hypothetical protein